MAAARIGINQADTPQPSPGNGRGVGFPADQRDPPRTISRQRQRQKRKTPDSSSSPAPSTVQRQKITRACDYCKEKKTRCTGTLPCVRCTRISLRCEYNAAYSRGLPPDPLPGPLASGIRSARPSPRVTSRATSQRLVSDRPEASLRSSPDPVVTDFEGNYLGPASGVSFLNRVWRRLHQDESSAIPGGLQDEASSGNTSVFKFGDKPYTNFQEAGFALPPFEKALELVGIYFDYSMVTYRFLHRGSVEEWLGQVYESNISYSKLPTGIMVARTAIILMIFAVGTLYEEQNPERSAELCNGSERWYAASKYIASLESGPPRLETVQARLGQCLYLLSSSRANECWYTFGTALQLVTALGLHRKWPAKMPKHGNSYLEQQLRKRILWSAYTLDKYLSVMFGRPRLLHDEDIDQELPDEINDEDMLQEDSQRRTGSPDCMMIASILHYRLGRILGEISRQLYTVNPHSRDPPHETAARLTSDLEQWKETAPPLFNSVRATSLIPPLCRQSQVLQLAYSHATIHATRSFLLNDFTDLSRRPSVPHPMVSSHVRKCIDAAEDVMKLVDSLAKQGVLIQSSWFTHYVCFCAIIVVYIHTIQQHRLASNADTASPRSIEDSSYLHSLFSLAESCQRHLAEVTRKNCPSRRYSIILEELRLEVHRQLGTSGHAADDLRSMSTREEVSLPLDQGYASPSVEHPISFHPSAVNYHNVSGSLQSAGVGEGPFGLPEDYGILDNLEGSIWWAQLDSWSFAMISSSPVECVAGEPTVTPAVLVLLAIRAVAALLHVDVGARQNALLEVVLGGLLLLLGGQVAWIEELVHQLLALADPVGEHATMVTVMVDTPLDLDLLTSLEGGNGLVAPVLGGLVVVDAGLLRPRTVSTICGPFTMFQCPDIRI
ncbi:Zn(II)2Cys6 transcription factor [Aspergillus clavatus NRRL 1]|uniref:Fungal specific transcription factor domain protein n=1 Tax=Aspergillus clavatus (strain ATCC 1007 / CBS 513.65 / DSM 816 / NCTC 3887 / NRRL 1 / QM 1276 / 107) TaxID=344612 RepID=A1CTQ4_ASPCL|nr:fungal specific transcription factor domain protein [Aspergillus clavatus NRRL 1]EAW06691.1 fungal specific transcription factor domain protein [Aspergillus clavatus NRRL 1]